LFVVVVVPVVGVVAVEVVVVIIVVVVVVVLVVVVVIVRRAENVREQRARERCEKKKEGIRKEGRRVPGCHQCSCRRPWRPSWPCQGTRTQPLTNEQHRHRQPQCVVHQQCLGKPATAKAQGRIMC